MSDKLLKILFIVPIVLSVLPSAAQIRAQTSGSNKTIEVKIHLLDVAQGAEPELLAVTRTVGAASPLRSALEAQVKGATEEEFSQALRSPFENIRLDFAEIKNKTARLYFSQIEKEAISESEALFFRTAVAKTALQFPAVKKVEICLAAAADFRLASGLKKCPANFSETGKP